MLSWFGLHHYARVLSHRNYRLYSIGNVVSLTGTWIQRIAVGWLTWELTGSTFWLGIVAFADLFPVVLIGLFAGAYADRIDRLLLTKISQSLLLVQALLLILLTAFDLISIWALVSLSLAHGVLFAFNQPARLALIASLLPRSELRSAIALNSVIFNISRFIGPAISGIIIVTYDVSLAFALNALSYVVMITVLFMLTMPVQVRAPSDNGVLADIVLGLGYILRHPGIGSILILLMAQTILLRSLVELLPAFAASVFAGGADVLAMFSSTLGLGAIVAGLAVGMPRDVASQTRFAVNSVLVMAVAQILFVATANLWFAVLCIFVSGFTMIASGISIQTLIQGAVQEEFRGRVMAVYGMVSRGGPAVGALSIGTIAVYADLRLTVAAAGLVCCLFWVWATVNRRRIEAALEPPAE